MKALENTKKSKLNICNKPFSPSKMRVKLKTILICCWNFTKKFQNLLKITIALLKKVALCFKLRLLDT